MDKDRSIEERRRPGLDFEFRAVTDRPSKRKCMSCHKPFDSQGWHNRLCNTCRSMSSPYE